MGDGEVSAFASLQAALTDGGFTTTVLAGQMTLPSDLSSYGQIWHYGLDAPSLADQQALVDSQRLAAAFTSQANAHAAKASMRSTRTSLTRWSLPWAA
jgi:hypothetical protein